MIDRQQAMDRARAAFDSLRGANAQAEQPETRALNRVMSTVASRRSFLKNVGLMVAGGAIVKGLEAAPVARATSPDDDRIHDKKDGVVTETVGRNEIIVEQGDSAPIVNGQPNKKWRDSNPNTALITVYNLNGGQEGQQVLVDNGNDWAIFTYDECPATPERSREGAKARALQYAQEMKDMKEEGTGASGRKWDRADVKVFGQDRGQGE